MIIAIDTGGTKTLIAGFDTDGVMQQIAKFPTPREPDEYLAQVTEAVTAWTTLDKIDAIALAVPGPVTDGILLRAKNIGPSWQSADIRGLLGKSFPGITILAANDADMAGISEARALDPVPRTSLYVTLSTGIGAGLAVDGKLITTLGQLEPGWMRLDFEGAPQMWEDFASGRNFYERYGQYGSEVDDPDKWRDFAYRASLGLGVLLPLLGPNQVIIGGSMGVHFAKYADYLKRELKSLAPDFDPEHLTQAKYPEEAVIYGCYYHAIDQLAS